LYDDESVLWHFSENRFPAKEGYREAWILSEKDGRRVDTLTTSVVAEPRVDTRRGGSWVFQDPVPQSPLVSIDRRGHYFTRVDRQAATKASKASFTVQRVSKNTRSRWTRTISYSPRLVPTTLADSAFSRLTTWVNGSPHSESEKKRIIEGLRRQWHRPTFFPPVQQAVVGHDGSVFLQLGGTGTTMDWIVLDPNGKTLGTFSLSSKARVVDGDIGHVWTLSYDLDADDPQSAARYRIGKM
jgi:hypothetical protein